METRRTRKMIFVSFVLMGMVLIGGVRGNTSDVDQKDDVPENDQWIANVTSDWKFFEGKAQETVATIVSYMLPRMLQLQSQVNISSDCKLSVLYLISKLRTLDFQALRLLDATGRPPSGVLDGTLGDLGDYDECLEVRIQDDHTNMERFRGQYCSVLLKPTLPPKPKRLTRNFQVVDVQQFSKSSAIRNLAQNIHPLYYVSFRLGVCTPSTCSKEDVTSIATALAKEFRLHVEVPNCDVYEERTEIDRDQLIIICVLACFVFIVICATMLDFHFYLLQFISGQKQKLGYVVQNFREISVYRSVKKIYKVDKSKEEDYTHFQFFHGLRFFGIVWIIWSHTYVYPEFSTYARLRHFMDVSEHLRMQVFNNAFLSVEMFFFMSAFLLTHSIYLYYTRTNGKVNFLVVLGYRWYRLVPMAMVGVGLIILEPLVGDGPVWKEKMAHEAKNCRNKWWAVLASAQNYYDTLEICPHAYWYICVDFQLYVIFLLFIYLLFRKPKIAIPSIVVMALGGALAVALQTYFYDYSPTILPLAADVDLSLEMVNNLYFRPYTHFGSFCMGILTCYIYIQYKHVRINKFLQVLAWAVGITSSLGVLFVTKQWGRGDVVPTVPATLSYASLHRMAWALGIAWMTFACATGKGGILNKFLSCRLWVPFSRLTYVTYLVHLNVVYYRAYTVRQRLMPYYAPVFYSAAGNIILSFLAATVFTVLFERPLFVFQDAIGKILIEKYAPPAKKDAEDAPNGQNGYADGHVPTSIHVDSLKKKKQNQYSDSNDIDSECRGACFSVHL